MVNLKHMIQDQYATTSWYGNGIATITFSNTIFP